MAVRLILHWGDSWSAFPSLKNVWGIPQHCLLSSDTINRKMLY